MDSILPPNAHKLADGRLYVSVTDIETRRNVLVSSFPSREDLLQVRAALPAGPATWHAASPACGGCSSPCRRAAPGAARLQLRLPRDVTAPASVPGSRSLVQISAHGSVNSGSWYLAAPARVLRASQPRLRPAVSGGRAHAPPSLLFQQERGGAKAFCGTRG